MGEAKRYKRLGEILIEQGVLTMEELMKALEIQSKEGRLIGEILVEQGSVSEEDVVMALAQQLEYPYLPLTDFVVNDEAIRVLPVELASQFMCIPVDKMGDTLAVAMADPSNDVAVRMIERASGCRIQAFVGTVSEIEAAISRSYKKSVSEIRSKFTGSALEMILKQAVNEKKQDQ